MHEMGAQEHRTYKLLMVVLIVGMAVAAYRASIWPDQVRSRNFIVVAPEETKMSIEDGPEVRRANQGIHTWSVQPGPLTLRVVFPDQSTHQTKVIIPKGLGGLMLKVDQDADGALVLGYF